MIANLLFQRRLTQSSGLALALILGSLALQVPALCEQRAGDLEGFLALTPSGKNEFAGVSYPEAVAKYLKAMKEAEREYDKGVAVANLAFIALELARKPETQSVATELCETWILPNLASTLPIEQTSSCCWRRTVMRCANLYKLTGDHEAERQCLALLYKGNRREGDQDLAIYLLAYQQARLGEHKEAIETINYLKEDSKWAKNRKKLIRDWTRAMKRQQKSAKP